MEEVVSTHPWLPERARAAVQKKFNDFGTGNYGNECLNCDNVLSDEFSAYVFRVKECLSKLPRGSKQYWCLATNLSIGKERSQVFHPCVKIMFGLAVHKPKLSCCVNVFRRNRFCQKRITIFTDPWMETFKFQCSKTCNSVLGMQTCILIVWIQQVLRALMMLLLFCYVWSRLLLSMLLGCSRGGLFRLVVGLLYGKYIEFNFFFRKD